VCRGAPHRGDGGEKVDHLVGVLPGGVEEVEAVFYLADGEGIAVGAVLEDELLEEEKGALVVDLLPHLDEGTPGVFGGQAGAFGALGVGDDEFDLEDLLEDGRGEDLWAGSRACLDARRVGAPLSAR
jgi:hypothetical protein